MGFNKLEGMSSLWIRPCIPLNPGLAAASQGVQVQHMFTNGANIFDTKPFV